MLLDNYLGIQIRIYKALAINFESFTSCNITSPFRFYFINAIVFLEIFPIIVYAVTEISVQNISNGLSYTFSIVLGLIKIFTFLYHRKNIMDLINQIRVYIIKETDPNNVEILKEECRRDQFLSTLYLVLVIVTATFAICVPLLAMGILAYKGNFIYILPLTGSYPYGYQNMKNYIFYFGCCVITVVHTAGHTMALDVLFCGISHNLCAIFKVIARELRSASSPQNCINIIKMHQWALNLAHDFAAIFRHLLFIQFLNCLIVGGINGFQISMNRTSVNIFFFAFFFLSVLTQLFIYGYCGQRVQDESTAIAQAVFESCWCHPQYYKATHHIAMLIIRRAQRACILHGYLFEINLKQCASVMRAALSYIALLRSLEN